MLTITFGGAAMRARWRAAAAAGLVLATGAACQSDGGDGAKELTYWASQQSPSVQRDQEILEPELRKFTERTGIEVDLEVVPFTELLTKILTATTSGQGPDVVNVGNTWSTSGP